MFCNVSGVKVFDECEMEINSLNDHSCHDTFIAKPSLDKNYKVVLRKKNVSRINHPKAGKSTLFIYVFVSVVVL